MAHKHKKVTQETQAELINQQGTKSSWRTAVQRLYPDMMKDTCCVPPVYFRRLRYDKTTIEGQSAFIQEQPAVGPPAVTIHSSLSSQPDTNIASCGRFQPHPKKRPAEEDSSAASQNKRPTMSRDVSSSVHTVSGGAPTIAIAPSAGTSGSSPVSLTSPRGVWAEEEGPSTKQPPVLDSDIQDDDAQQLVLHNLQELGKQRKGVMFILSQVNFSNYLNKSCYAAAVEQLRLPRPCDQKDCRGDFDVVIIHRYYGILVAEIKSVGRNVAGKSQSECDADVMRRLEKTIKQLNKSGRMMRYLVSDFAPSLTVRKTFILPYVSCAQLLRVLESNKQLTKEVRLCLGTSAFTATEIVQRCVCSDHLRDVQKSGDRLFSVPAQLCDWWDRFVARVKDICLTDDIYLEIIARFVGPATTVSVHCVMCPQVEIRTEGQAVSELGRRIARLVLTMEQVDLYNQHPPRAFLTGPPGSGKTLMLVLMGLKWLHQQDDVQILSTRPGSLAAGVLIEKQLKETLSKDQTMSPCFGKVVLRHYDFYHQEADVEKAVTDLVATSETGKKLHILMDEAAFGDKILKPRYKKFFDDLTAKIPDFRLWATNIIHANVPECFDDRIFKFTVPLRNSPVIQNEIQIESVVENLNFPIDNYTVPSTPFPAHGPPVIPLCHYVDGSKGHSGRWPEECYQCGQNIAEVLHSRLNVTKSRTSGTAPLPLMYRDVFVLTKSCDLHDDIKDDTGNTTSAASGVIRGLRDAKVPVCVLQNYIDDMLPDDSERWKRAVSDVAVACTDQVTVAWWGAVRGQERKVVVWLPYRRPTIDDPYTDIQVEMMDRLYAVSRATTQLIVVNAVENHPMNSPETTLRG